jgi:hypothetical protein
MPLNGSKPPFKGFLFQRFRSTTSPPEGGLVTPTYRASRPRSIVYITTFVLSRPALARGVTTRLPQVSPRSICGYAETGSGDLAPSKKRSFNEASRAGRWRKQYSRNGRIRPFGRMSSRFESSAFGRMLIRRKALPRRQFSSTFRKPAERQIAACRVRMGSAIISNGRRETCPQLSSNWRWKARPRPKRRGIRPYPFTSRSPRIT